MTAVSTPTGTPVDPSTLHRQSHITRNIHPKAAEAGSRNNREIDMVVALKDPK